MALALLPSGPRLSPDQLDAQRADQTMPVSAATLAKHPKNPKLESHLAELIASQLGSTVIGPPELPPDLQSMIKAGLMRLETGRVQVYVESLDSVVSAAADVDRAGGLVQRKHAPTGIVQALVPISQLRNLAASPSVKFVRLPDYGMPSAGSVTSEGDSILKANLARSDHEIDGNGVRVGVISDGVGGLSSSESSGDIASVNSSTCNVSGTNPQSTGAEGTAMLEIVHDLAPGAELWFGHYSTSLEFNVAVNCLAANTDVVVDDIGWFNAGPYDGSSFISANTSAALNDGQNRIRSYVTAVANEAEQHYQEPFVACTPGGTAQLFQATANTIDIAGFGPRCDTPVLVHAGGAMAAFLQWDDPWGAACNDYDMTLFDHDGVTLLAASLGPQTCSQNPAEELAWVNSSGSDVLVDLVLSKDSGVSRTFDLFTFASDPVAGPNFITPSSSVPNQSDAGGGVISVGAINASDPGNDTLEEYSSWGPTNDDRTKPDITGIDCVLVTGAGGFGTNFCGTSAAAPHLAGIAALLLQCKPSLKAGELGDNAGADRTALRNGLLSHAVDLGTAGTDNIYGTGRADARASANAICPSATATPTPTHSPSRTPSPSPTATGVPLAYRQGDANCSGGIDLGDIATLLKISIDLVVPGGCATYQNDVNCVNGTDALDALGVAIYLAEADPLPVNGSCTPIGDQLSS
jgi:hypothetical protein